MQKQVQQIMKNIKYMKELLNNYKKKNQLNSSSFINL